MIINMKDARLLHRKISRILAIADSKRRKEIASTPIKWWQRIFTNQEAIANHTGTLAQYDDVIHKAYQWMNIFPTLNCGHPAPHVGYMEYRIFEMLRDVAIKYEID